MHPSVRNEPTANESPQLGRKLAQRQSNNGLTGLEARPTTATRRCFGGPSLSRQLTQARPVACRLHTFTHTHTHTHTLCLSYTHTHTSTLASHTSIHIRAHYFCSVSMYGSVSMYEYLMDIFIVSYDIFPIWAHDGYIYVVLHSFFHIVMLLPTYALLEIMYLYSTW